MHTRFVIIGGGPAGVAAATTAARLGGEVVLIERDVVGGAANLWDCVPSKAMIATASAMSRAGAGRALGFGESTPQVDLTALRERIRAITSGLEEANRTLLESQGVRLVRGTGRLADAHNVVATTEEGEETFPADSIMISTGSRPRLPEFAAPDGHRVLVTRDAYPPAEMPEHLIVVGSGVTGVEFVHMFRAFGSEVSLLVSRQQVLPGKDPEVAAALEADFLRRGVNLLKGARADGIDVDESGVVVTCEDGRHVAGSHALLAIGSIPNTQGLGLAEAGVAMDGDWPAGLDHHLRTNLGHIYMAGDVSGKLPLASVAQMQGRKIAEHVMGLQRVTHRHLDYDKAASAIFTVPEIADVGLAEAEAFATGRKVRVTKVPFAMSAKALINAEGQGFVKLVSDPATGIVLGGSIVGAHAAELISVIALAVTAQLRVADLADSLFVHPALAESLAEAAE